MDKEGKIISWTIVRVPPFGYERQAPYPVVLVELKKGKKVVGQLVGFREIDLKTGRQVKTVYRRISQPDLEGIIPYGIKFKPT